MIIIFLSVRTYDRKTTGKTGKRVQTGKPGKPGKPYFPKTKNMCSNKYRFSIPIFTSINSIKSSNYKLP